MIQVTVQKTPAAGNAPVVAQGARSAPSASAIYEGFKAQRRELSNQLDELQSTRDAVSTQLEQTSSTAPERKALQDMIGSEKEQWKTIAEEIKKVRTTFGPKTPTLKVLA